MRSLLLAGLLGLLLGLCPRPSAADQVSEIFLEFPELAEWGRPVSIGGYEFWQPHPAYLPAGWEPYRNGYLYEDPADGLTWVSEDPWGFITEHYGYWRHHEVYGFVWRPLYPLQWRPYVASLFRDGGGRIIGWCPFYYDAWDHGFYVVGFGFNDYYWAPFWSSVHYGGFYNHHWWRFDGYYVSVTIYDYDRYWRRAPGPCHRRAREYRQGRHRDRSGDGRHRGMSVRSELPARAATAVRSRHANPEPKPTAAARQVEVSSGGLRAPAPAASRPARAVSAPTQPAASPVRESTVARERAERMQLLRDRMQSSRASSVSAPTPARRASQSRRFTPAPAPQRSSQTALPRGSLQVGQRRATAPAASRPSRRAQSAAPNVAPRASAPSRPALQAPARTSSRVERARKALPVQRKGKRDGS